MKEITVNISHINKEGIPLGEYASVLHIISENIKHAAGRDIPTTMIILTDGTAFARIPLPLKNVDEEAIREAVMKIVEGIAKLYKLI